MTDVKYPLTCGCAGPKYISKCGRHQDEEMAHHRKLMGIGRSSVELELAVAARQAVAEWERPMPSRAVTDRLRTALEAWDAAKP